MQIADVLLRGWHGLNTYLVQQKPKGSPLYQLLLSAKLRDVGHLPPAMQDSDLGTGSISQALWYCNYLHSSCARDRGVNSIHFCHLLVLSFSYMCHFRHFHILVVTAGTLQCSSLFGLLWQNYHKPSGFKTAEMYCSQFWRLEVQRQGASTVRVPLWDADCRLLVRSSDGEGA